MRPFIRLVCFIIGFAMILTALNTWPVMTDTTAYLMLHELTHRDDVELAIVGSSVVRSSFEPETITEETGLTTYCVALPFMAMQGSQAVMKLALEHHDPQWTVLVVEPETFQSTTESQQTQFRLSSFIKNPIDWLSYYVSLCREDGQWVNRLMLLRQFNVTSLEQLKKNVGIRLNPQAYYDEQRAQAEHAYHGSGFVHPGGRKRDKYRYWGDTAHHEATAGAEIPAYYRKAIQRFKALCEKKGGRLMVVYYPYATSVLLATPDFLTYGEWMQALCAELNIPFFNLAMLKRELLPEQDLNYRDQHHLSIEGAQQLSRVFGEIFNRYAAGEETGDLFYSGREAYLSAVDCVANTWVTRRDGAYIADSNQGTGVVPEYKFASLTQDGEETILRGYDTDPCWAGDVPEGQELRVYARAVGGESPEVYYDAGGDAY